MFFNGKPICDDGWDMKDADVVCKQLGFLKAKSHTARSRYGNSTYYKIVSLKVFIDIFLLHITKINFYSRFGVVPYKFSMSNVNCKGDETSIQQCLHRKFDFCGVNDGAGVECLVA